ncbi:MAG TPA: DUF4396 domain-containing protein [Rhizomicrobium sp.]|nr:DUF4396 domain-containing protein [Rhizomicrobium sp.]
MVASLIIMGEPVRGLKFQYPHEAVARPDGDTLRQPRRLSNSRTLSELDQTLGHAGLKRCFAELNDPVKDKLKRFGLFDQIDKQFFFATVGEAVDEYEAGGVDNEDSLLTANSGWPSRNCAFRQGRPAVRTLANSGQRYFGRMPKVVLRWTKTTTASRHRGVSVMVPFWLHATAIISLLVGAASALILLVDVRRHPQHMWIMDVVWPITALYAGPLGLWGYFRYGRNTGHGGHGPAGKPFFAAVGIADTHCGAGCTLGDILSEWLVFFLPAIAVWFGYQSIFSEKIFAVWVLDFILAFVFGIGFQYLTIAPMRGLGFRDGMIAALKSDTLTVTSWQTGMYGFMAIAYFYFFRTLIGINLEVNTPEFWFMMQIAMIVGFVTAYPMTWWLIRVGIKEQM